MHSTQQAAERPSMATPPGASASAAPSPMSSNRNSITSKNDNKTKNTIGVYFCFILLIIFIVIWKFVIIKHFHISEDHSTAAGDAINSKGLHRYKSITSHHSRLGEHSLENTEYIQHLLDEASTLLREVMLMKSNNDTIQEKGYDKDDSITHKAFLELRSELLTLQQSSSRVEHSLSTCEEERMHIDERLDNCQASLNEMTKSQTTRDHPNPNPNLKLNNTIISHCQPCPTCDCPTTVISDSEKSSKNNKKKWLVIGMPTVSRLHTEDYLLKSLTSIAEQLPSDPLDILYNNVLVVVVNVQGVGHSRFEEAKHLFNKHHPKSAYFEFITAEQADHLPDVVKDATPANDVGTPNKPGYRVRKQTRNLVTTMRKNFHKGDFYLFLEDDMKLCPNAMNVMQYVLSKAGRYHPNWLAIRASYGMNGIFMRDRDMQVFSEYLLKHQARRPPDHLVVEWYAGESAESGKYRGQRANIGFRYNLFDHLGAVSTLRSQTSTSYPRCYDELLEPTVFKVEAFSKQQCPNDDIWPCNIQHAEKHRLKIV